MSELLPELLYQHVVFLCLPWLKLIITLLCCYIVVMVAVEATQHGIRIKSSRCRSNVASSNCLGSMFTKSWQRVNFCLSSVCKKKRVDQIKLSCSQLGSQLGLKTEKQNRVDKTNEIFGFGGIFVWRTIFFPVPDYPCAIFNFLACML